MKIFTKQKQSTKTSNFTPMLLKNKLLPFCNIFFNLKTLLA